MILHSRSIPTADLKVGDVILSVYPDSVSADRIVWCDPYEPNTVRSFRAVRTIAYCDGEVRMSRFAQNVFCGSESIQPYVYRKQDHSGPSHEGRVVNPTKYIAKYIGTAEASLERSYTSDKQARRHMHKHLRAERFPSGQYVLYAVEGPAHRHVGYLYKMA